MAAIITTADHGNFKPTPKIDNGEIIAHFIRSITTIIGVTQTQFPSIISAPALVINKESESTINRSDQHKRQTISLLRHCLWRRHTHRRHQAESGKSPFPNRLVPKNPPFPPHDHPPPQGIRYHIDRCYSDRNIKSRPLLIARLWYNP